MTPLVYLLAALGISAVLLRAGRAAFLLLWRGVDAYMTGETRQVRARRGDITGMADAARAHAVARRRRAGAIARLAFWIALLAVPPFTPWTAALYATYAALWLLPRRPLLRPGADPTA